MMTINVNTFVASVRRDVTAWSRDHSTGMDELVILILPDLIPTLEVEDIIYAEKDENGEMTKKYVCGVLVVECSDLGEVQWRVMRKVDLP